MKEGFEAGFEPSGSLVIVGASAVVRLSPEDTKVFLTWLSGRPEMDAVMRSSAVPSSFRV